MTSVNTNIAATTALRTLQATNKALETTQGRISTGYKIGEAKDNAAYWAISTTLKSDNNALGTVKDALGLGAATVDTAYQGLNKAKEVLDSIKSKLTAATQAGVDRSKIQTEISELQKQLQSISSSSTFSGENWLSVDSSAGGFSAMKNIVSSFNRAASGSVSIGTIQIDTSTLALFDANAAAGAGKDGILDSAVTLSGVTVGGSNSTLGATAGGIVATTAAAGRSTATATTDYATATADQLVFDHISDKISLTVAVDGGSSKTVDIRLGTVQTALNNSANSVKIVTKEDMVKVLTQAFSDAGVTGVAISVGGDGNIKYTSSKTGSTSDVDVSAATAVDNDTTAGTLSGTGVKFVATDFISGGTDVFEKASATMNVFPGPIQFTSSTDKIKFSLDLDGANSPTAYTISKADVDAALGSTDGKIASAADFQTVLATKLSAAAVTVGSLMSGKVTFTSKAATSASAVAISLVSTEGFTGVAGTAASISVKDIDVSATTMSNRGANTEALIQSTITAYIDVVSKAIDKVTTAASTLGAVASRIDLQKSFVDTLMDTIDKGVSGLIDADMSEESTKLQALQTKQQLGVQALSIANSSTQSILSLFRG